MDGPHGKTRLLYSAIWKTRLYFRTPFTKVSQGLKMVLLFIITVPYTKFYSVLILFWEQPFEEGQYSWEAGIAQDFISDWSRVADIWPLLQPLCTTSQVRNKETLQVLLNIIFERVHDELGKERFKKASLDTCCIPWWSSTYGNNLSLPHYETDPVKDKLDQQLYPWWNTYQQWLMWGIFSKSGLQLCGSGGIWDLVVIRPLPYSNSFNNVLPLKEEIWMQAGRKTTKTCRDPQHRNWH